MAPSTRAQPVAIEFCDLTLGYERHPAVHHLDGSIAAGSLTAVVGPNGAGKSTLLRGVAGILRPLGGAVRVSSAPGSIAYLPQHNAVDTSFPISVTDFVALGLWRQIGFLGRLTRAGRSAVALALARVGLGDFGRRTLGTLSGGQLQRALFARLILQDAPIVLLDEPFTAVDAGTTRDLLELLGEWHRDGRTVLAVTHDLAQVRAVFPRTLLLAREPIAHGATAEVLTEVNLRRAERACEAFDDHAEVCEPPRERGEAA